MRIIVGICSASFVAASLGGVAVRAQVQVPGPIPRPTVEAPIAAASGERVRREQALAKLFEGQRHLWKLQRMQSQAGRASFRKLAKEAFEASVTLDPTLAEGYTALSQLAVVIAPRDIDEGIKQAELAVKASPENVGGHRMLARLLTAKSRLSNGPLDPETASKAQAQWREITRLEPRDAEAWAFLAAFAEARNLQTDQVEALRNWVSASAPSDVGFYEGTMNGARLSPETAGIKLASILAKTGKASEAASILADLISEDPVNAEAIGLLSEIVDSIEPNAGAATVTALQQAVYADPENVSLVDTLARLQARVGQFDEAAALLKKSIDSRRKSDVRAASTLAVSLSEIYLQRDRYNESAMALESALSIRGIGGPPALKDADREFAQYVFEKLIHVGRLADRPQTVRASIERARKVLGSGDLFADRQMIAFLSAQGQRREALSLIRSLRVNRPDDFRLLRLEASLLVDVGQVDAAVELVRRNRERNPADPKGSGIPTTPDPTVDRFSDLLYISNLYSRAKRGSEAIEAANQALAIAGGAERRQIARTTLATALEMSGDTVSAERTLRDILVENPGNPIALNNLGYFLVERGEKLEEAVGMISQALKVDPRNPSYLDSLGWAYFKLGRLAEAERYLLDAARADADSGTIREHLGDLYREKKNLEKARALWQAALRLSTDASDIERLKRKIGK